jgi:hypothetical protein
MNVGGFDYKSFHPPLRPLKDEGYQIQDDPDPSGDGNRYRLISLELGEPREKRVKIYLSENDAIALASGRVTENSASCRSRRSCRGSYSRCEGPSP